MCRIQRQARRWSGGDDACVPWWLDSLRSAELRGPPNAACSFHFVFISTDLLSAFIEALSGIVLLHNILLKGCDCLRWINMDLFLQTALNHSVKQPFKHMDSYNCSYLCDTVKKS
ncbi:hypothetical protein ILYODFUR_010251 [Ilyodon furcidens]|uniref:Uncharacterized protein n=1 Tax=Ilyodon furcidens TaxID=33524 RepID=A0ABV0UH39_9TELE